MKTNRMYDEFAHLWPLISRPEDYAEEASYWRCVLRDKLGAGRHEILELGVGGGNNLSHLTGDFKATAVDLSEKMLVNSRRLNPDVEHYVGDMRTIRLGRTFDAVLIHDAISYMQTEGDLRQTFATASAHLRSGGVLVTAPDYVKETFVDGKLRHDTESDDIRELTHIEYQYDPDPTDSRVESVMFYLIRQGGRLQVEQDRHVLGLFPLQRWRELIEAAGFAFEMHDYPVHENNVPGYLLVGVKP